MKKIKSIISLLPLLMIGMLTASCGSAEQEEAGGDKDYTVTNEEYVSKRSEFSNPKMILNTNVSWNYTFSNSSSQSTIRHLSKLDNGNYGVYDDDIFILEFDKAKYDESKKTTTANIYSSTIKDGKKVIVKTPNMSFNLENYLDVMFPLFNYLPNDFNDFNFSSNENIYTLSKKEDDKNIDIKIKFENKALVYYECFDGEYRATYSFFDFAKTSVEIPKDYIE